MAVSNCSDGSPEGIEFLTNPTFDRTVIPREAMARTAGTGRMIQETSVQISTLRERWHTEREMRYARRNRIRHIDRLLDELEMLNIAEETQLPAELAVRVQRLAAEMEHHLGDRAPEDLTIAESMDALYDLQDGLMPTLDGVEDEDEP